MRRTLHTAHITAFWDHIFAEISALLHPERAAVEAGWADWSRAAAAGEW